MTDIACTFVYMCVSVFRLPLCMCMQFCAWLNECVNVCLCLTQLLYKLELSCLLLYSAKCPAPKDQQITQRFNISDCVYDTFPAMTLIATIQQQTAYLVTALKWNSPVIKTAWRCWRMRKTDAKNRAWVTEWNKHMECEEKQLIIIIMILY